MLGLNIACHGVWKKREVVKLDVNILCSYDAVLYVYNILDYVTQLRFRSQQIKHTSANIQIQLDF